MGNWFSASEHKNIESDGQVNNNVILEGPGAKFEMEMLILTAIICAIKLFEFVIFVYKNHARYIKEKHERKLQTNNIQMKIDNV